MSRRHKYNAKPTWVDGIRFDSGKEAKRYSELKLREAAGEIRNLELQPEFRWTWNGEPLRFPKTKTGRNGSQIKYVADFRYFDMTRGGRRITEDIKGFDTPESRIKRAVTMAMFNVEIEVIR